MKNQKSYNIKIHFKKRCLARVGENLDQSYLKELMHSGSDAMQFLSKSSNRVSVYRYLHKDKPYRLYYDKMRHLFITIMPEDWADGSDPERLKVLYNANKMAAVRLLQNQGMNWEQAHVYLESLE